ncbi:MULTISPECIES: biotin/lipoyl-containing protein [Fusobacterium]|uniref:biotin/lipoyl-containing protein n=1 Tax=Fusobacterium TaxID=848 RepID=UPI001F48CDD5|nr:MULTISPECIES: biotin/lipoyl-containing protein [Fusobacterium]MCF2612344.1 acetyl-CoA carboxylase biotin carboxyl carrier protein subunit [Fusobacterium perfoetens]MDY2981269.1 biotin/lipoyl-containing protein [Fusobacterium sp.]
MKYIANVNGKRYEIELERVEDYRPMTREEIAAPVTASAPIVAAPAAPVAPTPVAAPAPVAPAPVAAPAPTAAPVSAGASTVVAPLPGTILDVKVAPGQAVKTGEIVIIMEAMKMETEVVAAADGVVDSILVKKGDAVDTDATLITLK